MTDRIEFQLDRAQRLVRELRGMNVPVFRIELDVNQAQAVIHTTTGPFAWTCNSFGIDRHGPWQDWVAHYRGVELRRRTRAGLGPVAFSRRERRYG